MDRNDMASLPAAVRAAVADIATVPVEEAVPAHMMELFSDQQWPLLIFQLQPSLRLITTGADDSGGPTRRWVIFGRDGEQLVRPAEEEDYRGLEQLGAGVSFDRVSRALWPDCAGMARHERLTALLLGWLEEGLIIDAGVPLPDDAEFETSPDDATRSFASSPGRETENR